jgi:hypothetical protein
MTRLIPFQLLADFTYNIYSFLVPYEFHVKSG